MEQLPLAESYHDVRYITDDADVSGKSFRGLQYLLRRTDAWCADLFFADWNFVPCAAEEFCKWNRGCGERIIFPDSDV